MQTAVQDISLATVPRPSCFYEPFEFHAAPGLTQEYEAKVRNGWKPTDPDYLTLNIVNGRTCTPSQPNAPSSKKPPFRGILCLGALPPSITLPRQSAACIHVALGVLTRLELYPPEDLRRHVGQYFHPDQVVLLARLCRLAVHLRVDLLEGLSRDLLTDIAHLLTPEDYVALLGIIYKDGAAPSAFLRAYVLAVVKQHVGPSGGRAVGGSATVPRACLSDAFAANYDPQSACPLFARIPPEIRNSIFKLALTEHDDTDHPYEQNAVYCRPDYRFRHRIDIDLLRTCRRIYLEAYLLPVAINEHVFWWYKGTPGKKYVVDPHGHFETMTSQQRDVVDCVHVFTHQFWLEEQFRGAFRSPLMRPRKLKITSRHTDWWFWEYGERLGIDPRLAGQVPWNEMGREPRVNEVQLGFGYQFRHLRGLQELEIEFETIKSKFTELVAIVQRALASGNSTCAMAMFSQQRVQQLLGVCGGAEIPSVSTTIGVQKLSGNFEPEGTPNSETIEGAQTIPVSAQESANRTNPSYRLHGQTSNMYQEAGQGAGRGTQQASQPAGATEEALPAEPSNGASAVQTGSETNKLGNSPAEQPLGLGRDQGSDPANVAYFVFSVTWRARPPGPELAGA